MSHKIRIVQVVPSLDRGGAEKQISQLSVHLAQRGHEVTIICGHVGSWETYLAEHGIPVIRLGSLAARGLNSRRVVGYNLFAISAIYRIFRDINPHIVSNFLYPTKLWATFAASFARVPVIINNQRDCGFVRAFWPLPAWVEQAVWRRTSLFVANSQAAGEYLQETFQLPAARVRVLYNGFSISAPSTTQGTNWREKLAVSDSTIRIGMLANFNTQKNHLLLVRAAKQLIDEFDDILFVLAGYPTDHQQVIEQEITRLQLTDYFRLVGPIQEPTSFIQAMDMGVLTSTTESFSNALLEFMAQAKPVVATRVGGNVEMVAHGETGLLVDLDDDKQLANALLGLIRKPEQRIRMGKLARQSVQTRYAWETITTQWVNLFESVLAELTRA